MHLTQVLQPQIYISWSKIAQYLGIPDWMIYRIEHWPHQLFVHRANRGGQFLSYRVFSDWAEACAKTIQACADLRILTWLGQVIKQDCQRFTYPQTTLDHWRTLWRQRHYQLRLQATAPPPHSTELPQQLSPQPLIESHPAKINPEIQ
ncbi:hypothetical protein [Leptolyngbya sp. FACHB-261]|uniref:hypothetical protein n=1 Tax=Leptolyngbya sp. FACHB-261 TaxID=2692806 RepID=UPI001689D516|nr:hypothetical protein [Leptolyngbya sp. FACHB-261]MBD2104745.1 hypothetical protein [Leptolyngbya sp. FACHB-261]